MNVGDYVRTKKDGIGRIISFSYQEDDECCFIELSNRRTGIKKFNIIKSSPNIIDLIEVGDYVNGRKVYQVGYNFQDDYVLKMSESNYEDFIYPNEIKDIITKEQFESMEYKVKE